jgi:hypothetical protein
MKHNRRTNYLYISAVAVFVLIFVASCGQQPSNNDPLASDVDMTIEDQTLEKVELVTGDETGSTTSDINITLSGELSEAEIEGLLLMREEEKLARDVYLALAELWNLPVFNNIAQSETNHMEAVGSLLDQYGLEDPAATTGQGVFTNPTLQELYDQLVAKGSQSLIDALHVGATIEEIDILDLEEYISKTQREDITFVYNNLLKGSRNHLRAFVSSLEMQAGETYQPQFIDQDAYAAIINASLESGGWGNGGRGNGIGGYSNRGNP